MVETFDLSVVPSADRSTHATGAATLADWIDAVRAPGAAVQAAVARLRAMGADTDDGKALKASAFPAITFSARFEDARKVDAPWRHSGIIPIDLDDVDAAADVRDAAREIPSCAAAYVTPSGVGVKLAIVVEPIPTDVDGHRHAWDAAKTAVEAALGFPVDAGNDVNRLAFASHDPGAWWTPRVEVEPVKWEPPRAEWIDGSTAASENQPRRPGARQPQQDTAGTATDALGSIDPAGLPDGEWVRIGMAAKSAEVSWADFDAWCQRDAARYNERVNLKRWESWAIEGDIGPGTLFHAAKQAGWFNLRARSHEAGLRGNQGRTVDRYVAQAVEAGWEARDARETAQGAYNAGLAERDETVVTTAPELPETLAEVLGRLEIDVRWNVRARRIEWMMGAEADWIESTDRLEADLRGEIQRRFKRPGRGGSEGRGKPVQFRYTQIAWIEALNALLYGREIDPFIVELDALAAAAESNPSAFPQGLRLTWAEDLLGVPRSELNRAAAEAIALGMVARAYEPGSPLDLVPILQGPQGVGKSKTLRALAGPAYFSDSVNLTNRDAKLYEAMDGAALVELAEIEHARYARLEALKQFITQQQVTMRPAYARRAETVGRTQVLVGTSNAADPIPFDPTGARRFHVLACAPQRDDPVAAMVKLRPLILADAVRAYRAAARPGIPWALQDEQAAIGREFMQADDLVELFVKHEQAGAKTVTIPELVVELELVVSRVDQHGHATQDAGELAALAAKDYRLCRRVTEIALFRGWRRERREGQRVMAPPATATPVAQQAALGAENRNRPADIQAGAEPPLDLGDAALDVVTRKDPLAVAPIVCDGCGAHVRPELFDRHECR